ncbi:amidohydrolase family protein [Streptomyces sp. NPDC060205]|uniref:amidohydrolase family protein n=1 Tax=Streptomyces sp. NPDC060205 TaxID=3347072 RepID=UPI00364F45D8
MSLDAGVTTVRDESHISNSPAHSDAAIAAHWESGIRAVFDHGWPSTNAEEWQFGSVHTHPDDIRRIRDEVLSDDSARVTLNAMLRGPELSTLHVAEQDIRLARDLGLRISMHVGLGEWGAQQQAVRQLADTGLLASDMTFIHLCTSTDDELRMVAAHGATASVAGALEAFMPGLGHPTTNRLLAAGIRPSLSVDTETIVSGDMFGVMRATLAYQQLVLAGAAGPMGRLPGLPTFDAADLLSFAAIEGARAAGIDDRTGSLTPGKDADLIMIRLDLPPAGDTRRRVHRGGRPRRQRRRRYGPQGGRRPQARRGGLRGGGGLPRPAVPRRRSAASGVSPPRQRGELVDDPLRGGPRPHRLSDQVRTWPRLTSTLAAACSWWERRGRPGAYCCGRA